MNTYDFVMHPRNRKHTLLFAGYANNKQNLSSANADTAISDAMALLTNSPQAPMGTRVDFSAQTVVASVARI